MKTETKFPATKKRPTTKIDAVEIKNRALKKTLFDGIMTKQISVTDQAASLTKKATPAFIEKMSDVLHNPVVLRPGSNNLNLTGDTVFINNRHLPLVHDLLVKIAEATKIIDKKFTEVQSKLGASVSDLQFGANDGFYRKYAHGGIYLSPNGAVHEVHGAIYERYVSLRAEAGLLGYPETDETSTTLGTGKFNHFKGGSIFWSPASGAWEIHGAIRNKWLALFAERSFLGFPTSNEESHNGSEGRISHFQRGSIIFTWGDNETIVTSDSVMLETTITAGSVRCTAKLWMNSKGDWHYEGKMINNSLIGSNVKILSTPKFQDANGNIFVVEAERHLSSSIDGSDRRDDWDQNGADEPFIRDNWDTIKFAGMHTTLHVNTTAIDIVEIMGPIFGAVIVGIIIGSILVGGGVCGPYGHTRRDPMTGEDVNSVDFQAKEQGQPCPKQ